MVAPLTPDQARLAAIREALPAVGAGIYLNSAAAGPLPAESARAMAEIAAAETALGRGHPDDTAETGARIGEARGTLAAILATDLDAVGLAAAPSQATVVALASAGLRSGDRVVTLAEPAAGPAGSGLSACLAGFGIDPASVPLDAGGDDAALLASVETAITTETRLLVIPHVADDTGRRLPVERLAEIARAHDAAVLVDGGQSVGAIPLAGDRLGADFLVFPSDRWLLGPSGLGGLWVGPRFLDRARAIHPTGFVAPGDAAPGSVLQSEWHRPSVVGFGRSTGWLAMQVGLPWAWERGGLLAATIANRLSAITGVAVLTPVDRMATIVTFTIAGWTPEAALQELGARIFAIAAPVPHLDAIRISPGAWTSEVELERFAGGVALLAAHTPVSLPPRRSLAVLP